MKITLEPNLDIQKIVEGYRRDDNKHDHTLSISFAHDPWLARIKENFWDNIPKKIIKKQTSWTAKQKQDHKLITQWETLHKLYELTLLKSVLQTVLHELEIEELKLENLGLNTESLEILEPVLSINNTLKVLNLSGNKLDNEGAVVVARILNKNSSLTQCYLTNNTIGDCGAETIMKNLKNNINLHTLYLNMNFITNPDLFLHAHNIGTINVAGNLLKNVGDTIPTLDKEKVKKIDFSSNEIAEVPECVVQFFEENHIILDLRATEIEIGHIRNTQYVFVGADAE